MIKSVIIINSSNEELVLDLMNPYESGFIVESITGIGPVKAAVNMTEMAVVDGDIINSKRIGYRNIVMNLSFIESPSIEETRYKSYQFFPVSKKITVQILTDHRFCEIQGVVESNEPDIFSKEEGCQISIICENPFFNSGGEDGTKYKEFNAVESLFTFPFSNESLTENLIEFGRLNLQRNGTIYYNGDYDSGIIIRIHALGHFSGLNIYNLDTRETISIDNSKIVSITGKDIVLGDEIVINTHNKKKSIYLLRGGVKTNILNALGRDISWFQLRKGDNIFAYVAETGLENVAMTIEWQILYEGV